MSMNLTATQLRRLADNLEKLEKVPVDVKTFIFEGHAIIVDRMQGDDRQPGRPASMRVRGITDKPAGVTGVGHLPGYRDAADAAARAIVPRGGK